MLFSAVLRCGGNVYIYFEGAANCWTSLDALVALHFGRCTADAFACEDGAVLCDPALLEDQRIFPKGSVKEGKIFRTVREIRDDARKTGVQLPSVRDAMYEVEHMLMVIIVRIHHPETVQYIRPYLRGRDHRAWLMWPNLDAIPQPPLGSLDLAKHAVVVENPDDPALFELLADRPYVKTLIIPADKIRIRHTEWARKNGRRVWADGSMSRGTIDYIERLGVEAILTPFPDDFAGISYLTTD